MNLDGKFVPFLGGNLTGIKISQGYDAVLDDKKKTGDFLFLNCYRWQQKVFTKRNKFYWNGRTLDSF